MTLSPATVGSLAISPFVVTPPAASISLPELNITTYGAVEGTDASAAIQATVAALPVQGGTIVVNGSYIFGTTIDMGWVPDLMARYGVEVTL